MIRIFAALGLLLILSCGSVEHQQTSPDRLAVALGGGNFVFAAPKGYCIDARTLQVARGEITPESRFANVVAANCANSENPPKPDVLENLISISATPAEGANMRDYAEGFNVDGQQKIQQKGDLFIFLETQGNVLHAFDIINGFLVSVRITKLSANKAELEGLMRELLRETRQANAVAN